MNSLVFCNNSIKKGVEMSRKRIVTCMQKQTKKRTIKLPLKGKKNRPPLQNDTGG